MRPEENALELGSNDRGRDELRDATREIVARLTSLGVWLSGREGAEALVQMEEAIERFEEAVRAKGGDLMVDEPPRRGTAQPDDPDFALPTRHANEPVTDYLRRLMVATDIVWRRETIGR